MLPEGRSWRGAKHIVASRENVHPKLEAMKLKTITRKEQLQKLRNRYAGRGAVAKSRLLNELCDPYGDHRKYVIGLLNASFLSRRFSPGPPRQFDPILEPVQHIWNRGEKPCGKRIAEMLPLWLPYYYQRGFGKLLPTQRKLLDQVSAASLDRLWRLCVARICAV